MKIIVGKVIGGDHSKKRSLGREDWSSDLVWSRQNMYHKRPVIVPKMYHYCLDLERKVRRRCQLRFHRKQT